MKILFFPFILLGKLAQFFISLTGSLIAIILGFVFIPVGILLTITVIGSIIGIPLIIIGLLMVIRGLFK
ncbi:MAG: hypothetical protein GXY88_02440 [Tissierellia bacterium]|nr:hypothetical protein [Tissierellia bacterium]